MEERGCSKEEMLEGVKGKYIFCLLDILPVLQN